MSAFTRISKVLIASVIGLLMGQMAPLAWADGGEPQLGEILWVGFNFAPRGWAKCDGQLLTIAQYSALFSLLGTTYGGDGRTTFGLPDMRGRTVVGQGRGSGLSNYTWGQKTGSENRTLSTANLPAHNHSVNVTNETAETDVAAGYLAAPVAPLAGQAELPRYKQTATGTTTLATGALGTVGNSEAVDIRQPSTTLQCIIALQGTYPSRN
jgi:microcystin-dependent protein